MDIVKISLNTSFFIIFVIILRAIAMYHIPKRIFVMLWDIAILLLIVPFRIPSHLKIHSFINNIFNNVIDGISPSTNANNNITIISDSVSNIRDISVRDSNNLNTWFVIWIIGISVLIIYFTISFIKSSKRLQLAIPISDNNFITNWIQEQKLKRKIKVLCLDRITSPVTCGIFRPKIILPKIIDYSNEKQLDFILTHELMHIKRFDVLLKSILIIVTCIYWFNPLVWIMYVLVNRDMEISCDEKVLSIFGEESKSEYALSLINLVEPKAEFSHVYSYFGKNAIQERIVMIMNFNKISKLTVTALIALVLSFTSIFAMTKAEETPNEVKKYIDDKNREITFDGLHEQIFDANENIYTIDFDYNNNFESNQSDVIYDFEDNTSSESTYITIMTDDSNEMNSERTIIYKPYEEKEYLTEDGFSVKSSIVIDQN
ncbi:penicillin-binding protein [Vallitalea longa]|uniref:Penicillin-binding protein n=1 Tax=Vallitalea longa TaxID=2936439 RepID=A0A9W5YB19_9FIRM|nr:penicillin-binding protein [Vallitalea longa]